MIVNRELLFAVALFLARVAPRLTSPNANYTVQEGRSIILDCHFENLDEAAIVVWSANRSNGDDSLVSMGEAVSAVLRDLYALHVTRDGPVTRYDLEVLAATVGLEGHYSCQVFGTTMYQGHNLTVLVPPTVELVPSEPFRDLTEGDDLHLECAATGKPPPTVTWARTGGVLPGGEAAHPGGTYDYSDVTRAAAGEYFCIANNGVGDSATAFIEVVVMFAPVVRVASPVVYTGTSGSSATLSCEVDANPPVEVVWRHNNTRINFLERSRLSQSQVGSVRFQLQVSPVTPEDLGLYQCVAGNALGQDTAELELRAEPHSLTVASAAYTAYSDQYTLAWTVHSQDQLVDFTLQIRQVNASDNATTEVPDWLEAVIPAPRRHARPTHSQSHVLSRLHASATYELRLRARNVRGYSAWTDAFTFSTNAEGNEAPPPSPPPPPTTQHKILTDELTGGVSMVTVSATLLSIAMVTTIL